MQSGEFCRSRGAARWSAILSPRTRVWVHVFAASLSRELCGMPGLERRVRAPSITLNTGIAPSRISKNSGTFDELSKKKKKSVLSQDGWCIAMHPELCEFCWARGLKPIICHPVGV